MTMGVRIERYLAEVQPESGVSFHIKYEEENFIAISPSSLCYFVIPEAYFSRFVPNRVAQ